ncbi:MAG: hypothetical protein JO255_09445 [Alphaproteobacteria bacterium]|nr:hypothetical protein [Alphaproteobacteria bacterium]
MACPVEDLREFLLGSWRISRRIYDARLGLRGHLEGSAAFTPSPGGLVYEEAGRLRFGAYEGEAAQRFRFAIEPGAAATVHRADGSLFHRLELSSGTADIVHDCGADRYCGRYRVLDEDRLRIVWHVTGPRKRYRMTTLHWRVSALLGAAGEGAMRTTGIASA